MKKFILRMINIFIVFYKDPEDFYFSNAAVFWFAVIAFLCVVIKILQEYNII